MIASNSSGTSRPAQGRKIVSDPHDDPTRLAREREDPALSNLATSSRPRALRATRRGDRHRVGVGVAEHLSPFGGQRLGDAIGQASSHYGLVQTIRPAAH